MPSIICQLLFAKMCTMGSSGASHWSWNMQNTTLMDGDRMSRNMVFRSRIECAQAHTFLPSQQVENAVTWWSNYKHDQLHGSSPALAFRLANSTFAALLLGITIESIKNSRKWQAKNCEFVVSSHFIFNIGRCFTLLRALFCVPCSCHLVFAI